MKKFVSHTIFWLLMANTVWAQKEWSVYMKPLDVANFQGAQLGVGAMCRYQPERALWMDVGIPLLRNFIKDNDRAIRSDFFIRAGYRYYMLAPKHQLPFLKVYQHFGVAAGYRHQAYFQPLKYYNRVSQQVDSYYAQYTRNALYFSPQLGSHFTGKRMYLEWIAGIGCKYVERALRNPRLPVNIYWRTERTLFQSEDELEGEGLFFHAHVGLAIGHIFKRK